MEAILSLFTHLFPCNQKLLFFPVEVVLLAKTPYKTKTLYPTANSRWVQLRLWSSFRISEVDNIGVLEYMPAGLDHPWQKVGGSPMDSRWLSEWVEVVCPWASFPMGISWKHSDVLVSTHSWKHEKPMVRAALWSCWSHRFCYLHSPSRTAHVCVFRALRTWSVLRVKDVEVVPFYNTKLPLGLMLKSM